MNTVRSRVERFFSVPDETEDERRQKFVDGLQFRAVTCCIFMAVFALLDQFNLTSSRALPGVSPLLIFLGSVNIAYWYVGQSRAFPLVDFFVHWVIDEITISLILFRLGGLEVPYGFLAYVMIVVTSATFVSKRASFAVASGAAISSLVLAGIELGGIRVPPTIWSLELDPATKIASVVFAIIFYFIFAYLAGTLAEQLTTVNQALRTARNQIVNQNRELETKVSDRTNELERRNSEIEEFVHVVTHDLKNVSVGTTEVARLLVATEASSLTPRGQRYAEHLIEDSRRMNEMLSSLLSIFRFDRVGGREDSVDVRAIAESVFQAQTERLERKRIRFAILALPVVRADEARLTHVLTNLVDNAIKYVGDKAEPRIEISSTRIDGGWEIRVSDNGVGVAVDQQDRIFQLYHRGPNQIVGGQFQGGEGVGLAMCRKIVERWGGEIWVESALGIGSTFVFVVPDISDGENDSSRETSHVDRGRP